jgi:hypothetical protein
MPLFDIKNLLKGSMMDSENPIPFLQPTQPAPTAPSFMDNLKGLISNPQFQDTMRNLGTALNNDTRYINYKGIDIPVARGIGERLGDFANVNNATMQGYSDAKRLGDMYRGLGINLPEGTQFKSPDELANYAKLWTDIKKSDELNEYRKGTLENREAQIKTMEMLNNLKAENNKLQSNDKNMTMKEILDTLKVVNPAEADKFMKKYDFSLNPDGTQKNAGLLGLNIPNTTAQHIIDGIIPLNAARTINLNTKTKFIPEEVKIKQQNADSNTKRANKPTGRGGRGGSYKPENNPEYASDLADYLGTGDSKMKEWGRKEFIRKYRVDPEKKLQQNQIGYGR